MRLCLLLALVALPIRHASAQDTALIVVHQGARVRALVPSLGTELKQGIFSKAKVSGQICLGLLLDQRDPSGGPMLILLRGIARMDVDRRTNIPAIVLGLPAPGEGDWQKVAMTALRQSDATCPLKGQPRS
jgi:hypothetical protein